MLVLSVCMFMPAHIPQSKARAEAEAEALGMVPGSLLHRHRVVYTDRAEGRYPLQAQAGADPHHVGIEDVSKIGAAVERRAPRRADVHERLARQAEFLGDEEQRKAEFARSRVIVERTQRVA